MGLKPSAVVQPCGGAIPLCMVDEFDIPAEIIDRKVTKMKMISPSNREVDVGKTLSETEYIGMCRREVLAPCTVAAYSLACIESQALLAGDAKDATQRYHLVK